MANAASGRDVQRQLDAELNQYSWTHNNQFLEDSPNKSELDQFGDFSGSHSQFDQSPSLERGMGADVHKSTDFSMRSVSGLPAMSTLSSLSSRSETTRRAMSEGGDRKGSLSQRFTPSTRKVTAIGAHESESDLSPSKYYQPARTPQDASRKTSQLRKVSPKSFTDQANLYKDLGIEEPKKHSRQTSQQVDQSIRVPRQLPDLSTLMSSARKPAFRNIDSVPIEEDNQRLFAALQDLKATVADMHQQSEESEKRIKGLKAELQRAQENIARERQRAAFAESELKQQVQESARSSVNKAAIEARDARIGDLTAALDAAEKEMARLRIEDAASNDEERNNDVKRLARALERGDTLQIENDSLKEQITLLKAELATMHRKAGSKPQTQKQSRSQAEFTDEGIDVSKSSFLNDSEKEDLSREILETRRRTQRQVSGTSARLLKKSKAAEQQRKKAVTVSQKSKRQQKPQSHRAPAEVSEAEIDSSLSAEDAEASDVQSEECLSDASDVESDAQPPVQLKRKPVIQSRKRGKATQANVEEVISRLSNHEPMSCKICSAAKREASRNRPDISKQTQNDGNTTIRPSQPPEEALGCVLSGLQDEYTKLQAILEQQRDEYRQLDPAVSQRHRKGLANEMRTTIDAVETKGDQIYAIIDVFEAGVLLDAGLQPPHTTNKREWIYT